MHSTSERSSHGERCGGLPRMWWPLWPLQWLQELRVGLFSVLPFVAEQRWRPEQCRGVR
jgi:hypothetical protein